MRKSFKYLIFFSVVSFYNVMSLKAQLYDDQLYLITGADSLVKKNESMTNLKITDDGKYLMLIDRELRGEYVMQQQTFAKAFDRGLPSWNGWAPDKENSAMKFYMRFEIDGLWQSWIAVGYWNKNIWSSYGNTTFAGGKVDIDYVSLTKYSRKFQFKVVFERESSSNQSPRLRQLAFFASNSSNSIAINDIVADCPQPIYINTTHYYQYGLDSEIGGYICSPTSVSMVLNSYGMNIDPLLFARRNYDPYWEIYGVWPRVVAHASEYGLNGVVNRYRSWSEAARVLKKGGRIVMSIGQPLYPGHLVMLAGFDANGDPLIHDPAKPNGKAYHFNKTEISKAWFNEGGIAYTFYKDNVTSSVILANAHEFGLKSFPNPVSSNVIFQFQLKKASRVSLLLYDLNGRVVCQIADGEYTKGINSIAWCIEKRFQAGVYLVVLQTQYGSARNKMIIS